MVALELVAPQRMRRECSFGERLKNQRKGAVRMRPLGREMFSGGPILLVLDLRGIVLTSLLRTILLPLLVPLLVSSLLTGCVAVHSYPRYSAVRQLPDREMISVEAETTLWSSKAIPALVVLWVVIYEQPYETYLTFRSRNPDVKAVRVDAFRISSVDAGKQEVVHQREQPLLGEWVPAEKPGAETGPAWGVVLGGFWWPLPLPHWPSSATPEDRQSVTARIGPFPWEIRTGVPETLSLRIDYTIRASGGDCVGRAEIPLRRGRRIFLSFAAFVV